jgi:hypothetical protein
MIKGFEKGNSRIIRIENEVCEDYWDLILKQKAINNPEQYFNFSLGKESEMKLEFFLLE